MQRSPADPNPADTAASAAASRSASGSTIMWFFAPPSACTRFPAAVARSKTWRAIGVEPTKLTAAMPGWSSSASTASASPCTTCSTPGGKPTSAAAPASISAADGSFSLGLRMKALPQATASGNIHSGTIAGKFEGRDPTHHAERLAERVGVDAAGHALGEFALQQVADPAGELDHLEAACHLPLGVGARLAVLGADHRGELGPPLVHQLAE